MPSPKTKKVLFGHARKRAYLRYGLELTQHHATEFEKAIEQERQGEAVAVLVEVQSLTRALYDVTFRGRTYRVAYNTKLRSLITFLPEPKA